MFITFQARSGRSYLISIVKRSGVNFFTDENSAFDLDAEIIDGSLESNLELEMLENGPVKYRAKYNDEGASVLIKVRHGDVEVGKR